MTSDLKKKGRPSSPKLVATRIKTVDSVAVGDGLRPTWRRSLLFCFLLAIVTIGLYSPVGRHPFVDYDDQGYVTDNPHVTAGVTWETLSWALTATEASNWHPVTWVSHAIDCELYGLNAGGHHWTSLLLHVINVILLYLLLQRVTAAAWPSLFVATLFAVHPLNVESVAWIAERKNVLSTMFFLLALGTYGWYARKPSVGRYIALAALFVLGLASKPMVITLPFVLLLLDYWPLQRVENWSEASEVFPVQRASFSRLVLEKLPLVALSVASAVITIFSQTESLVPTQALPLEIRLETALYAYSVYIWKMFWPVHLALVYPHPGRTLATWKPLVGLALICIVSIVAWTQRSKRPYLMAGWLWYLGTAVPIIGIVQVGVQVIADRYAYIPLIGLFVIVAWGLLAENSGSNWVPRVVASSVVLVALALTTWRQIGFWRSSIDVWSHAVEVTADNSMAERYLADALFRQGRYQDGMPHLRRYAALEPLDPMAHAKVAADYEDHGQFPEAAKEYETAIHASATLARYRLPGLDSAMLAVTYANLGVTYRELGDLAGATDATRKALNTDAEAVAQMIQNLGRAVAAHPTATGYIRLGMFLLQFGSIDQAQEAFTRARRLDPHIMLPAGSDAALARP